MAFHPLRFISRPCLLQVYDVIIDKLPVCTCPDASKGNHCKHLVRLGDNSKTFSALLLTLILLQLFVFLKGEWREFLAQCLVLTSLSNQFSMSP